MVYEKGVNVLKKKKTHTHKQKQTINPCQPGQFMLGRGFFAFARSITKFGHAFIYLNSK